MKAAVMMLALVEIGTGSPTGQKVTLQDLTQRPRTYLGQRIVIPGIACVNDPKAGFLCIAAVGGQALRVEAFALGAKTSLPIAERLIGDCKGTANLKNPSCRFDVEIEPTSGVRDTVEGVSGSQPVTVVVAPQIEMYTPSRRR